MVRRVVFWLHLATGLTAGLVILVMAVTGALLAFEPQLVDRAERELWAAPPPTPDAARLPLAGLVTTAQEARGGERATTVTVRSDPASSVRVGFGRDGALYVHPYTGAIIGPGSRTHDILHVIEDWHRWLGSRDLGRPITGVCNLAFLGLALSGLFLWWPRGWNRGALRAVALLDMRLRGRARDFNWHNTIGFWCSPVIVVMTLTGAVMSYQWANDLLYRATGNEPPPAAGAGPAAGGAAGPRGEGESRRGGERAESGGVDLDAFHARAASQLPQWLSLTLRLPQRPGAPVTAFIQEPATWHPSPRSILTLNGRTAEIVRWEPFREANGGRTLRALMRVAHTGEVAGIPGQLIAGVASAGGAVLVYTGMSLAWRRYRAWSARRRRLAPDVEVVSTS